MLKLADGSAIEMRSNSALRLHQANDGVQIHLDAGSVIVNAARQRTGHLYVKTRDMTVSVVGTVFLVNAEEEGSRVAVIEGEVRVQQGEIETKLRPGQQVTTNPAMESPTGQPGGFVEPERKSPYCSAVAEPGRDPGPESGSGDLSSAGYAAMGIRLCRALRQRLSGRSSGRRRR